MHENAAMFPLSHLAKHETAELKELEEMDLTDELEAQRMIANIRAIAPAAVQLEDEALMILLGGYLGVIGRFRTANKRPDCSVGG